MRHQLHLLLKSLDTGGLLRDGDLSEAGAVEVGGIVDPGLGQRGLGPAAAAGGEAGVGGGLVCQQD